MRKLLSYLVTASVIFTAVLPTFISPALYAQTPHRGLVVRLPGQDDFYIDYLAVQPGDTRTGTFKVQHEFIEENTPADVYLYAADFEISPDGNSAIDPETGLFLDTEYSLARHITFDKTKVTLDRYGDNEEITFTINIPADAQPGFKYARILASGVDPAITDAEEIAENTGAGIKSRITVATLLVSIGDPSTYTISGEIDGISLRDIDGNRGIFGWLFDLTPLTAVVNIKNTGNQPLLLGGNVTWHGGDPTNAYDFQKFNEARHRVMPQKSRVFSNNSWTDGIMYAEKAPDGTISYKWNLQGDLDTKWGKHYVDVRISYKDQKGETKFLLETIEFWLLPWKAILLAIIVLLIVIVYLRYRGTNKPTSSNAKKKLASARTSKK